MGTRRAAPDEATRILLQARVVGLESELRVLREQLGAEDASASPSPAPRGRRSLRRAPSERVAKPTKDQLEEITDLDRQRAQNLLQRGGKYR